MDVVGLRPEPWCIHVKRIHPSPLKIQPFPLKENLLMSYERDSLMTGVFNLETSGT